MHRQWSVVISQLQDDGGREVVFLERRPTIGEMFGRYQTHTVGKSKLTLLSERSSDRVSIF